MTDAQKAILRLKFLLVQASTQASYLCRWDDAIAINEILARVEADVPSKREVERAQEQARI